MMWRGSIWNDHIRIKRYRRKINIFCEKYLKMIKNWIMFGIRNTIVYIFSIFFFAECIKNFGMNGNVQEIIFLDDKISTSFLLSLICILSYCLLNDCWLSKKVTKLADVLKVFIYIFAVIELIKPEIETKIYFEVILFIIFLLVTGFSVKNLFWEKNFQFKTNESIIEDNPVFEREKLTKNQKVAFDQLNNLLENSSANQSYVSALVGDWGTGKTSITNSLYNLHKDEYLFLLIDLFAIKKTNDLIEYVNSYFKDYFYFYGIGFWGGSGDISFLKAFIDSSSNDVFQNIWKGWHIQHFHDIHSQRADFSNNIQKFLKRSGKRKIVLIVDDLDRIENEEEIYPLLWEITEIPGIFSILNLSEKKREDEKKTRIGIEKYLQAEILLENKIYLTEKSLSEDIIKQYEELRKKWERRILKSDYFEENEKADKNCFPVVNYKSIIDKDYNKLIEIFYRDFINGNYDFGTMLQKRITEYYARILGSRGIWHNFFTNDKLKETAKKIFGVLNNYTEMCSNILDKRNENILEENKEDIEIFFGRNPGLESEKIKNEPNIQIIAERVLQHIFYSALLWQFFAYLTNSLDNYRTFKWDLREATLLRITYLENIIRKWQSEEMNIKEKLYNNLFSGVGGKYRSLFLDCSVEYLLTNIFYNTYINKDSNNVRKES